MTNVTAMSAARPEVSEIEEMAQAAAAFVMRGHLCYLEDTGGWLANAGERWVHVEESAVDEFFGLETVKAAIVDLMCLMAEEHSKRILDKLETWREQYPASYVEELEPYARARADLQLSREEFNGVAAHLWEQYRAEARKEWLDRPAVVPRAPRPNWRAVR